MCVITDYESQHSGDKNWALNMASNIANRGPDDFGAWLGNDGSLAMVHRCISIVDFNLCYWVSECK